MKIGLIGSGGVGEALLRNMREQDHDVRVANSRGPQSLAALAAETGATAVTVMDAVKDVDLIIISIPQGKIPILPKDLLAQVPQNVPVIETGNYYPGRDGRIADIDGGMVESAWVSHHLGRPVIKAFNNIYQVTIREGRKPKGAKDRIALPIAGDDPAAKAVVSQLIDDMGFDPLDAGSIAESWRQQPGSAVYATNLDIHAARAALAKTNRSALPLQFEKMVTKIQKDGIGTWQEFQQTARDLLKD